VVVSLSQAILGGTVRTAGITEHILLNVGLPCILISVKAFVTISVAVRRGIPRTAWMDNIKTWTGLPVEESVRMTEDRDKWRKYVHGVANPWIEDG